MGALMREYWIPAALSSELAAGGPPLRLMLLGEKLIAFRDGAGRVGILDHRCPHRCASLFFGRNESDGVRCVYHGWKYDVAGNCLETPNVPPELDFRAKIKARAYAVAERNGLIWTYMGARATPPPLPMFEAVLLPESELRIVFVQRECNWLQALEGDIDTSHFAFLHLGSFAADEVAAEDPARFAVFDRAPDYHVAETAWGTMYAAHRKADAGRTYWRFAQFLFPFWAMPPDGPFRRYIVARAWVPMDDTHTMAVLLAWKEGGMGLRTLKDGSRMPGTKPELPYLPNSTDWYGRWRLAQNASNDYLIDREVQRKATFTGIEGVMQQDQAITESMGPIVDRSFEHLAPSDRMIVQTRRRLAAAARALASGHAAPPGVDDPEVCQGAHSGDFITPEGMDWMQAYAGEVGAAADPTGALRRRMP